MPPARALAIAAFLAPSLAQQAVLWPAAGSSWLPRAALVADTLATCAFLPAVGLFSDLVWQSGSTLETLADTIILAGAAAPARWANVATIMYEKLPAVVDNCFDDHQWYLLAWVRAFEATGNASYAARAAEIFDFVAQKGWDETLCGGGVTWCPPPTSPYKNAITVELFISSAMALAPYEAALARAPGFYVGWAGKAWRWLAASGMVNAGGLVNDGLDGATCRNNNQTTWTYNQGVLLSGLARLAAAGGGADALAAAERVARAAMARLAVDGVLTEPCGGGACGGDGSIFKGVFVRHLAKLARADAGVAAEAAAFLGAQAAAVAARGGCGATAAFGFRWDGPCEVADTATTVAALDALAAAAAAGAPPPPAQWRALGLGDCADAAGAAMPNCFSTATLDERACRDAAWVTPGAVAYDFSASNCLGATFCRVRTLAGAGACAGGARWGGGGAGGGGAGEGGALAPAARPSP